ncbi:hypothetical protein B5S30_g3768 [[Candida] boidinii]|nr:hypothetical protein B5S30_g3768 [[Candida] boidinii]
MATTSRNQETKSSKSLTGNNGNARTRDVIVRSSGKFTGISKQQQALPTRPRTRSRSIPNGKSQSVTTINKTPVKFKRELDSSSDSKKITGNPLFQALKPENRSRDNSPSLSTNPLYQALKPDSTSKKPSKLESNPLFKVLSTSTSATNSTNSKKSSKSSSSAINSKNLIDKKSSTSKLTPLEKLLKSGANNGKKTISDALRGNRSEKPINPLEQALKGKSSRNNGRSKGNNGNTKEVNNNRDNNRNDNRNDKRNGKRDDHRNSNGNNNRNTDKNDNKILTSRSNRSPKVNNNNSNNSNNNNNLNNSNKNNVSNGISTGSPDLSFVNAADIRFLRIRNLKPGVNEGDVIIVMSKIGPVSKILLKESSKSTVAEVFFQHDTDTVMAYTKLNNKSADGRTLRCEIDNKSTIIQDKDYWNHFVASLSHQRTPQWL